MIVDEAHRLRSAATRRYAILSDVCRRSRVLLVSATPVQNRRDDLAAQLALFAGRRAWMMSDDELASYVVRNAIDDGRPNGLPRQSGPHLLSLPVDDDCLDQILALPASVPAKDESIAAALLSFGMIHQWTSSRAALVAALRRRRTRGLALMAALDAGRRPTRAELAAWTHLEDAMQLAFPELVTASTTTGDDDVDSLVVAIDRHVAGIEALLGRFRRTDDPDVARANALREVRARHPGERIIAFCHYAETVNALRAQLVRDSGVAALTARGGRVAGGRVSREEILAQFSPRLNAHISAAERIDLLITTDLLSEGLNLQEASVVVHLDLPWNPARLEQRVGRVRRLGARHDVVTVYVVAPPAPADRVLRMDARLREKLRVAQRMIGVAGRILPSAFASIERGAAEDSASIDVTLRGWLVDAPARTETSLAIAAVCAERSGFLAAVHDGHAPRLIADLGDGVTEGSEVIVRALMLASGPGMIPNSSDVSRTIERIERHLRSHRAAASIDLRSAAAGRSRRAALARVARAVARTPRHQRAQMAALADAARAAATAPLAEGAERILELLVTSGLPDDAWLRSIASFGELNARPGPPSPDSAEAARIVAVILFQSRRL